MDFANILILFDVSGHPEHSESLTVVFHLCNTVLEGITFNMAANKVAKTAKFNLLLYKIVVVTKVVRITTLLVHGFGHSKQGTGKLNFEKYKAFALSLL